MLAPRDRGVLIYDGDLTGRPVSNTSTTYPGAGFGWMGDGVQLGYQAALVSLHSPTYGRLWLSVAAHPGNTVSSSQAEALVRAAEAHTGVRPRRRTDLLVERIGRQQALIQQEEAKSLKAEDRVAQVRQNQAQLEQERQEWARQLVDLEQSYAARNRPERPYSHLAQMRRKLTVRERRLFRCQRELARARRWLESRHDKLVVLQQELEHLDQRLDQFREDNVTNPWPIRAIFRLDGGFGSGPNVALLIELGYDVYTKATSHQTVQAFHRRMTEDAPWTRVGKNAEMVAWEGACITHCPLRLDVALERSTPGTKYGMACCCTMAPTR